MVVTRQTIEEQYHQGIMQYNNAQYAHALITFEQVIALDPFFAPAYNGKGAALYNLACYGEALNAFEKAIQLHAAYAHAHYNKGAALYCLKRHKKALKAFQQASFIDPSFSAVCPPKDLGFQPLQAYNTESSLPLARKIATRS